MLSGDDTSPDQVFAAIRPLITEAKDAVKVVFGSYVGIGANQNITLPFAPKFFACVGKILVGSNNSGALAIGLVDLVAGSYSSGYGNYSTSTVGSIDGNIVSIQRLTSNGNTYYYVAIA